jgi:uncharacterized protein (DUF427 family)
MWNYPEPFVECVEVAEQVAFYWAKVEAWFEEAEEVFIGPKDPYTRVDMRDSSREVKVVINGETVAETTQAVMFLETGQPHRYYIPKTDVRMDLLKSAERTMKSTYKGVADYYDVEIAGESAELMAWCYEKPFDESARIAGYICFPQGKVEMYVDGVREPTPKTRWD